MYPRSFLCEEAKTKQHTSSKKELCEIGEGAIWESRFTCFSDSNNNKIKFKKIKKDAIQSRRPSMPYSVVLIAIR